VHWSPDLEPWPVTLCCILGHLGVQMGTSGLNAGGSPAMNFSTKPSTGGEELLLVTLYYRNQLYALAMWTTV